MRLPSLSCASWIRLSPSSGTHPLMYTSAWTWSMPVAAFEMTAPPYEWPTMTIGPSIDRSSAATYAASLRNSRSGFAAPIARKPWPRTARIEPSQPLLSAHAPWTKTTVGLLVSMLTPWLTRPDTTTLPRIAPAMQRTKLGVFRDERLGRGGVIVGRPAHECPVRRGAGERLACRGMRRLE